MTKPQKNSRLTLWQAAILGITLMGYAALVGVLGRAEASKETPPPPSPEPETPKRIEVHASVAPLPTLQVKELPPLVVTPLPLSQVVAPTLAVPKVSASSWSNTGPARPVVQPLPTLPPVQPIAIPTVAPLQVQAPPPAVVVAPVTRSRGS